MNVLPLVSIIIPVYNGSDYVSEAINSALDQTYKNLEVIVINDGSTDEGKTEEIVLSFGNRIRYYAKPNGGVSSALNLGISVMKGEYFSWLSHDDKYEPRKIEEEVALLRQSGHPKSIALCAHSFINSKSEHLLHQPYVHPFSNGINSWELALQCMLDKGTYNGCAFLIPKAAFDCCGYFHEKLRYCQDQLMWAKFFLAGYSVVYSDYPGVLSRIHGKQQTQLNRHLIRHDSEIVASIIAPQLSQLPSNNLLFVFARRNAKFNNKEALKICHYCAQTNTPFSVTQTCQLLITQLYGCLRPLIRKVYYMLFLRVKTR